jgi:hypothetical protein
MTIILPTPPEESLPDGYINMELAVQRDLTEWFISARPINLILTPTRRDRTSGGGYTEVNLPPRPAQKLRLISMSASQKPTITDNGVEREIDLTLLGPWNAQIDIGDWWRDGEGLFYEVIEMVPFNGYEVRALVVKKGHG